MKSISISSIFRLLPKVGLSAILLIALCACNAKKETEEIYSPSSSVAVTSFSLKSDKKVAAHLDSVFFSINLDERVIYNADSLPKGTKTDKLIPVITYPSTVTSAIIIMQDGERFEGESNYKSKPNDTIDFSGRTFLRLTAEDGTTMSEYEIKINVHRQDPDSLFWTSMATSKLPSQTSRPTAQKTLKFNGKSLCLVRESDATYTLSSASDLFNPDWQKATVTFPAEVDVESFTATSSALYILSSTGQLMKSDDGLTWTPLAPYWDKIIGAYSDNLLGLRTTASGLVHTSWPADAYPETPIEEGFPVSGFSNPGIIESKWSATPVMIIFGGVTAVGDYSNQTWGFDGAVWVTLTENRPAAISGATLVPYLNYRSTNAMWIHNEFPVWLIIGGTLKDGTRNRTVYISYDNGVNWRVADSGLQLPEQFPSVAGADIVTEISPRSAALSNAWTRVTNSTDRRLSYKVDNGTVEWDARYMFLFGGYTPDGKLNTSIWHGVLGRMLDTPLF